ncbi:MAG TPA: pilin, partial [Rhodanobacteraceae bacterium]
NTSINGKYTTQLGIGADGGVSKGQIAVLYGNKANTHLAGDILVLSPISHAGSTEWHCNSTTSSKPIPDKYLPASCRGAGQ